ncbi:alpha/beta-hydrolase [Sporormia fimetaria CBS 119925]|uniref:Alpha/beta-hydrolase n=1 Tax=Sporormia fimetaria CBS 119925 TaxID=1340428 RepID=A0A6A6UZD5_9PLEO|nr:alpha/beta-hydrolase [Sporormia fimetaria CBS 119925]
MVAYSSAAKVKFFSSVKNARARDRSAILCSDQASEHSIFAGASTASPIIVYLPPGPVLPERGGQDEPLIAALASTTQSTIARINYRFSCDHSWPTPLHDVLRGYDWVTENLASSQPFPARLGVLGELVGGTLATSIALTECRVNAQTRIAAAAVNSPIADWVFPDELPAVEPAHVPEPRAVEETSFPADHDTMAWWAQQEEEEAIQADETVEEPAKPKKRKVTPKAPQLTAWQSNTDNPILPTQALLKGRDLLFPNPQHIFDRFASPVHFFRSPYGELIYPASDDILASVDPIDWETRMDINHYESYQDEEVTLRRCRAYARIHPAAHSGLTLPQWHITTGRCSPLMDQATELAKMLKRGISRQHLRRQAARSMWKDKEEKLKYEQYANARVSLQELEGAGLWTRPETPEWERQIEDIGLWMKATCMGQYN